MAEVTKTQTAAFTPVQVAEMALGALAGNLQLAAVANRNWEPLFARMGETVNVPVRGAVVANDKVAGSDVTEQTPAGTTVAVTLDTHKEATIIFEDVARAFANQDVIQGYAQDAAVAIAEAVEIGGFVCAYTNFTTNADIGVAATDLTTKVVLQARKVLKDAKVPKGAPIYLFLSTKDMQALLELPEWSHTQITGSADVIENAPMEIRKYGMTIVETQYAQVVAGTTHNLALCPSQGLTLACRPLELPPAGVISAEAVSGAAEAGTQGLGLRMVLSYRPEKQGVQMTIDCLHGWAVVRGAFGVDTLS